MERLYKGKSATKKLGGGLKDMPQCEHCGRPVKISSNDDFHDEVLCVHCASNSRTAEVFDY